MSYRDVVARWFPDKKGLAVGLAIVGFGLSPLITAPLANQLINAYTVRPTLRILGLIFMALILGIATTLKLPPRDWHPHQSTAISAAMSDSTYPKSLLKSRSFYELWICYAFCIFWFCLGGWLAMAPATTLQFFDLEQYAQNYGLVFTAYGVGALTGTLVTGQIRDWLGTYTYTYAFYPTMMLAIVGIVGAVCLPRRDRHSA